MVFHQMAPKTEFIMNISLLTVANSSNEKRWIGLASISPQEGNNLLDGCHKAFVPVIGDAINEAGFIKLIEIELAKLDFDLLELEDIESLATHLQRHTISSELITAIESISSDSPIAFGTFQAF